ncbi:MAG: hypothetical protein HN478_13435, partial [Rhodospirillaceae bacterium]|nr:hypothetical protein [Rhodospirillaceae bacterium]
MSEPDTREPGDLLWDYLKGFHAVHHMAIGTELGLFEAIHKAGEGGCAPLDLAAKLDLHPPYVDVWCRTGYHYGLLEEGDSGCFRLGTMV